MVHEVALFLVFVAFPLTHYIGDAFNWEARDWIDPLQGVGLKYMIHCRKIPGRPDLLQRLLIGKFGDDTALADFFSKMKTSGGLP